MADLIVNTDYEPGTPEYCKEQQLLAVEAINNANSIQLDGAPTHVGGRKTYSKVWTTHGCYVGAGNSALDEAIEWRDKACKALADASEYLASLCHTANEMYKETDDFAAGNLKKQMVFDDGS